MPTSPRTASTAPAHIEILRDLIAGLRRAIGRQAPAAGDSGVESALEAADDIIQRLGQRDAEWAGRVAGVERLLSELAHDLTNALTVVVGVADRLQNDRRIPRAHRDKIALVAEQGRRGTDLVRRLAELRSRLHREPAGAASGVLDAGTKAEALGRSVLLIEDQDAVRLVVSWQLEGIGYQVQAASNADEALAALREFGPAITVAVLDWVLPGTDGSALLDRMRALHPALPIIVLTAHPLDTEGRDALRRHPEVQWVEKPATIEQLRQAMQRAAPGMPGSAQVDRL